MIDVPELTSGGFGALNWEHICNILCGLSAAIRLKSPPLSPVSGMTATGLHAAPVSRYRSILAAPAPQETIPHRETRGGSSSAHKHPPLPVPPD